jgi:hypothetical protein
MTHLRIPSLVFAALLVPAATYASNADGTCSPAESAASLCFQSSDGFIVEAVCGPSGEFPVVDRSGNSHFEYLVTGPGGDCSDVRDISHVDLQLPVCSASGLVILDAFPAAELLTNGQGDNSCNFGGGDLSHDVLKWDIGVPCEGTRLYTLVLQGAVGAEPTTFLIKAANNCETATILGPSCDQFAYYCYGTSGCGCGNDDPGGDGGCSNATGQGARLTATGSTSVAADDLVLTTDRLPVGSTAWLIMGRRVFNTTFEDGLLCVGRRQYVRVFAPQAVGASGIVQEGPGIVAYACSTFSGPRGCPAPGTTSFFQTYYRNPNGMIGDCWGKNFSNAVAVTFH